MRKIKSVPLKSISNIWFSNVNGKPVVVYREGRYNDTMVIVEKGLRVTSKEQAWDLDAYEKDDMVLAQIREAIQVLKK